MIYFLATVFDRLHDYCFKHQSKNKYLFKIISKTWIWSGNISQKLFPLSIRYWKECYDKRTAKLAIACRLLDQPSVRIFCDTCEGKTEKQIRNSKNGKALLGRDWKKAVKKIKT